MNILFYLILSFITLGISLNTAAYAIEISELEEITMQVIDDNNIENIEVQQMINIPLPAPHVSQPSSANNVGSRIQSRSLTDRKPAQEFKKESAQ